MVVEYTSKTPTKLHGTILRPLTANSVASNNWRWTKAQVAAWRAEARKQFVAKYGTAQRARGPVKIWAQPFLRDRRSQDPGACYPTVKAVVDGLVDARFLTDDTASEITSITLLAPAHETGRDGLFIGISDRQGDPVPIEYAEDFLAFVSA